VSSIESEIFKNTKHWLIQYIEALGVVSSGRKYKLSGGGKSNWYFDAQSLCLDSFGLNIITELFWKKVIENNITCVGGPVTSAIPIVSALVYRSYQTVDYRIKGFYWRGQNKRHGDGLPFAGFLGHSPRDKIMLVDDVWTTGKTLSKCYDEITLFTGTSSIVSIGVVLDRNDTKNYDIQHKGDLFSILDVEDIKHLL